MSTDTVDMDFAAFVRLVLDALETAGVTYMIGGAVGVWAWGDVRTTRDIDLVIELPFESAMALSRELEEEYIETWVERLGLAATWNEVQRQITVLGGYGLP